MKPKIAILGEFQPNDTVLFPHYEFARIGSVYDLVGWSAEKFQEVADAYDLIVLGMFGATTWEKCYYGVRLMGRKAKVAVWTLDSHNEGWAAREAEYASAFDGFFSSSSQQYRAILGPKCQWLPCCLVWQAVNNLSVYDGPKLYDFASIYGVYPSHPRHAHLMSVQKYLFRTGYRWIMGQTGHVSVHSLYSAASVVVNCCMDTVPNMRSFEAIAAGAYTLQHPAGLFDDPRFEDLRLSALNFNPAAITGDEFAEAIGRSRQEPDRREIIKAKHTLIHRYAEIAEKLL